MANSSREPLHTCQIHPWSGVGWASGVCRSGSEYEKHSHLQFQKRMKTEKKKKDVILCTAQSALTLNCKILIIVANCWGGGTQRQGSWKDQPRQAHWGWLTAGQGKGSSWKTASFFCYGCFPVPFAPPWPSSRLEWCSWCGGRVVIFLWC